MKFTLTWLKEHLETDRPAEEIGEALTSLGLELDAMDDPAAKLAPFKVAYVAKAEPHPDADKLKVCEVDTGEGTVQVVCGAPNARTGMKGVFAPSGTYIPGIDLLLKPTRIRGVESNGMLVSERELELSDDHEGIIDVAAETPVGTPVADVLGLDDVVFEIGLTPDRADCAGVHGIARDLAAKGIGTLKPVDHTPVPAAFDTPVTVTIAEEARIACPVFAGRLIRGVKNGPSPAWLQRRLTAIGLRPISALVDITNFFTFGFARPLHVYDAARLTGGITVALSRGGEALEALNDKSYTLGAGQVTINDDAGVLGLGGIVGGTSTGVEEDTVDVFLECALFDPKVTAATGRALQIDSDARYRFERGVDPATVLSGIEMATRMILDLCGGEPGSVIVAGDIPEEARKIGFRPARVASLGGLDVAGDLQATILEKLGFTIDRSDETSWIVAPPSWRHDVEGEADIVEEVLRVHGFDHVPATPLPRETVVASAAVGIERKRAGAVRRALAARGLHEAVTWSFIKPDEATLFRADTVPDELYLQNPISTDMAVMRPSPLPGLIAAAIRNAHHGVADVALFEVGPAYETAAEDGQRLIAAGVRFGHAIPRGWEGRQRAVDAYDAKADALAVLRAAQAPNAEPPLSTDAPGWYHPGRSAVFRLGRNVLARFGELHPSVKDHYDVSAPLVAFEVFVDAIPQPKGVKGTARPHLDISPYQAVHRDFAFVIADDVPSDKLLRAVKGADKKLIGDVTLFDVYRGPGVAEGKKSLAIGVTLQPRTATLTEAEIEAISTAIVKAVTDQTGGTLR